MRGNGRKAKHKRFKLLRGALHRGMAVALGVFLLASQLDIATYAVEDSVIQEEVDTGNPPVVTQPEDGSEVNGEGEGASSENTEEKEPETNENGGEESEQNPGGGEGEEEPEAEMPGDENPVEEAVGEAPAEPVAPAETEETTEREARAGETFYDNASGLNYEIIDPDNHYVAASHKSYRGSGTLTIPETVTYKGVSYTVTQIPENGFQYSADVQEIVIPDSVKVVGKNAFIGCGKASKITLSRNLEEIGEGAFQNCQSLAAITIPGSVNTIGKEAFWLCKELTEVTLENPNNPITYGTGVFFECAKLRESDIKTIISSPGMTQIPNSMFTGCDELTQITIPERITRIGSGAFLQCEGLVKVTIPSSVTEIGSAAFEQCKSLTDISMADGLTTIGERAFFMCSSLKDVKLPDTVTTVDREAFSGCSGLEQIKLSAGLSAIGDYIFAHCTGLKEVTIPQGVTYIGERQFWECDALQSVTLMSSVVEIRDYAFADCTSLNELKIAVPVTEEDGQKKVTPVTVHASWNKSKNEVFRKCPQEQPLVFLSTDGVTPLTGDDLAVAADAYKKVKDTYEYDWDSTWYGWKIPATENPPVPPPVTYHKITASATEGGTIAPGGDIEVAEGGEQTFTMTPDEGCRIKSVMVDLKDVTWEEAVQILADEEAVQTGKAGTYTFRNVQTDHTIEVSFEKVGGGTTGEENPPKGDDPDNPGNDKPVGGTPGSDPGNDDSDGGTANTDNTESPAAEVMVTVVDSGVQAAPAVVTETAAPAASNGQNQTAAGTQGKEPKTGDSTQLEIYATLAMIAGLTYMLLYFIEEGRGMTEREKDVFVAAFIRWAKKGGAFRKCCALVAIFCILAYYHSVGKCSREKLYPALH